MPRADQKIIVNGDEIDRLRVNSRAKHLILKDYLPAWAGILGKFSTKVNYFDCFAGPGEYYWKGKIVEGSPIISVQELSDLMQSTWPNKPSSINLVFLDSDENQLSKLKTKIDSIKDRSPALQIKLVQADSESLISENIEKMEKLAPSFFFIDPYGHPFSLSLMNKIMKSGKAEIIVNFMYYMIIRDIENPQERDRCNKLFAPDDPTKLDFKTSGKFDTEKMFSYLHKRIGAKYFIPFRVNYGPDEKVASDRPKYYLIHYSNNFKAFDVMLHIMWKHSDAHRPLEVADGQPILFPLKSVDDLRGKLFSKYQRTGERIAFQKIVEDNWSWYYLEKHYRDALKKLKTEGKLEVIPVTSKRSGLGGEDTVVFH